MDNGKAGKDTIAVIGSRIRELREGIGMSQGELGQAVKSMAGGNNKGTQSFISNLENSTGEKLPSVQVLRALALTLGTNTDYLLGLTNDDRPHGDVDDQIVITVEDPNERRMLQEAVEMLAKATAEDKEYIVGLIRRLAPKKPRIIGGE